jgi:hypothetical protein
MRLRTVSSLLVVGLLMAAVPVALLAPVSGQGDEDGVDPFGPPEGPIPFPIWNLSSSDVNDRFPSVYADDDALRVLWEKEVHEINEDEVIHREYDGTSWRPGEDWVSMVDPQVQQSGIHEQYSHDGVAVSYKGLVYLVFSTNDPDYGSGTDFDIALRTLDPSDREWGPIEEVTSPIDSGEDRDPLVTVFKDRLIIAWRTNDPITAPGIDDDIVLRTYDGAAFSDIVEVSAEGDGQMDTDIHMAVVGDSLALTWSWNNRTVRTDDFDVLYREWDGTSFTTPVLTVSVVPERVDRYPKVAEADGDPFVVWESRPGPGSIGSNTFVAARVRDSDDFSTLINVTRPDKPDNRQPDVVSVKGKAYILWESHDDSLTHGSDSDIVMCTYDGKKLSDVLEISHPRDGNIDEGAVVGCVFKGNLYAVWSMGIPVVPPVHAPFNDEIVCRRVTDDDFSVEIVNEYFAVVGELFEIEVRATDFTGAPVEPEGKIVLVVTSDLEVIEPDLELVPAGTGIWTTEFTPKKMGNYAFTVMQDGRVMDELELLVRPGDGENGDDLGDSGLYLLVAIIAVALGLLAVYLTSRKK